MNRRTFIRAAGAAAAVSWLPWPAQAASARGERRLLVLVELKGGNDGFNTLVPYTDAEYYRLRPSVAIPREQVLSLDARAGLHPELRPLLTLWQAGELALIQNVGYPKPNLSHFRSIEIWDTASSSSEYLDAGWLTRSFMAAPLPPGSAADGVVVGGAELGPLGGAASRAVTLTNPEQFLNQSRFAMPGNTTAGNPALAHVLRVEQAVIGAAARLRADRTFTTAFPAGNFGNAVRTAAQVAAANAGVPVIKLALNGFDTHVGQLARQRIQLPQHRAKRSGIQRRGRTQHHARLVPAQRTQHQSRGREVAGQRRDDGARRCPAGCGRGDPDVRSRSARRVDGASGRGRLHGPHLAAGLPDPCRPDRQGPCSQRLLHHHGRRQSGDLQAVPLQSAALRACLHQPLAPAHLPGRGTGCHRTCQTQPD